MAIQQLIRGVCVLLYLLFRESYTSQIIPVEGYLQWEKPYEKDMDISPNSHSSEQHLPYIAALEKEKKTAVPS